MHFQEFIISTTGRGALFTRMSPETLCYRVLSRYSLRRAVRRKFTERRQLQCFLCPILDSNILVRCKPATGVQCTVRQFRQVLRKLKLTRNQEIPKTRRQNVNVWQAPNKEIRERLSAPAPGRDWGALDKNNERK